MKNDMSTFLEKINVFDNDLNAKIENSNNDIIYD